VSDAGAILVTGADGFIGAALCDDLRSRNCRVIGAVRHVQGRPDRRRFDLTAKPAADLMDGVSTVVHAAYVRNRPGTDAFRANVDGSAALFAAARAAGARIVFLSSLSARMTARSVYGRQKFTIEGLLRPEADLGVRPGLVLGQGGIAARIMQQIARFGIVPVVDRGLQPLQTVHVEDLVTRISELILARATGLRVIAETPAVPYREFFTAIASAMGRRVHFVSLPSRVLLAGAGAAEFLRLPLGIDRDNVLGLLDMAFVAPDDGVEVRPYDVSVRKLIDDRKEA
jgi:nucleoside-diphosphate-sugar epimerase